MGFAHHVGYVRRYALHPAFVLSGRMRPICRSLTMINASAAENALGYALGIHTRTVP